MRILRSKSPDRTFHFRSRMRRYADDTRGTIAITFGFLIPILVLFAGLGIDFAFLASKQSRLQAAVDAAALRAGRELNISTPDQGAVIAVASDIVKNILGADAKDVNVDVALIGDPAGLTVTAVQKVKPFFAVDHLGGNVSASASVQVLGGSPLCILALEDDDKTAITLEKRAHLTANECAVYSNSKKKDSLKSDDGALLEAEFICTAGGKVGGKGNFDPEPLTDCPKIDDPLKDRAPPRVGICDENNLRIGVDADVNIDRKLVEQYIEDETKDESGKTSEEAKQELVDETSKFNIVKVTLRPGVYCGGLMIGSGAEVSFMPGTYIMKDGPLFVTDYAKIDGNHVGFYFDGQDSNMYFGPKTTIRLTAPKTGPMAGLLIFEDRSAKKLQPYAILSDNARLLEGTIYLPESHLYIDADAPMADHSAYTAIIARQINLYAGPHLILNTDYNLTDVPVPEGIDNNKSVILTN